MEKSLARELLRTGYKRDRKPIAVHGTCVEAAVKLLQTGVLPTSYDFDRRKKHPSDRGYLFFTPRAEAFRGKPEIYKEIKNNPDLSGGLEKLEHGASLYAGAKQRVIYLRELFGPDYNWPKDLDPENGDDLSGIEVAENWLVSLGKNKYRKPGTLGKELESRNGVIIGLNEEALELDFKPGADDPEDEVMVHLPNGLKAEYVLYIRALGNREEIMLEKL